VATTDILPVSRSASLPHLIRDASSWACASRSEVAEDRTPRKLRPVENLLALVKRCSHQSAEDRGISPQVGSMPKSLLHSLSETAITLGRAPGAIASTVARPSGLTLTVFVIRMGTAASYQ